MTGLEGASASPNRVTHFIKSLYYDPFRWTLVKSFAVLFVGIRIARECKGFELMPAQISPPAP